MQRILTWLALVIAASVIVVAVMELDDRADDDRQALEPTPVPSPSTPPFASEEPTDEAGEEPTDQAPEEEPTASLDQTAAPEEEPTSTAEPPRTPTPAPAITAGPVDTTRGGIPKTGASSLLPGLFLAFSAAGLRVLMSISRRSY